MKAKKSTEAKSEPKEQPTKIGGVKLVKVQPSVLVRYAREIGIDVDRDTNSILDGVVQVMGLLARSYRVPCDVCDGVSDKRFLVCPFCGGENLDENGKRFPITEYERKEEQKAFIELRKLRPDSSPPSEPVPPFSAPLAIRSPEPIALLEGEDAYDASIRRLRGFATGIYENIYDFAAELLKLHDTKLYMTRKNEEGRIRYTNWTSFVDGELRGVITVRYSYQLMRIPATFTRAYVTQVGWSKCAFVFQCRDDEMRKQLAGKLMDQTMTMDEVRQQIVEQQPKAKQISIVALPEDPQNEDQDKEPTSIQNERDPEGVEDDGLDSLLEPVTPRPKKKPEKPEKPVASKQRMVLTATGVVGQRYEADAFGESKKEGSEPRREKLVLKHAFFAMVELANGQIVKVRADNGKGGLRMSVELIPAE